GCRRSIPPHSHFKERETQAQFGLAWFVWRGYDSAPRSKGLAMRVPRFLALAALAALLALVAALHVSQPAAAPPAVVPLGAIRYDDLTDRVVALQGRVVVVDFWADYCLPCKREFPHLVELHRKYGASGLAAVSVSLDDSHDDETRQRVRKFLIAQGAEFANFLLDEKPQTWQAKLKIDGPPCVFVFDRRGRLVKRYHDHVDYAEIERLVADLLR